MLGHFAAGLWTSQVFKLFVFALPFTVAGLLLGNKLNKILQKRTFDRFVHILLMLIGILLIVQALQSRI